MKLFSSLVHYCLLSVFQSLCTLSIWFSMCLSNSFPERTQPASTLVIIDRKPEYEISQIVDSKINCWQVYKLLYKVIWLEYKDTEDKFEWIPASELTYAADLISDFYIAYPIKPGPLSLF